jgi:hypothetical protein
MGNLPRNLTRIFVVLAFSAPSAFSCSCAPKPPVGKALSQADAVFIGRVIAWHNAKIETSPGRRASGYSFVFEVERLFKGRRASEVAVFTGIGRGDCGYPFQVGEQYLVYAFYTKEGLETNICTRTTTIGQTADLAELGVPKTVFVHVTKLSMGTAIAIFLLAFLTGIVVGKRWLPGRGRGKSVDDLSV